MTKPHVGYSDKQIAHAVSLDTNHANAFVAAMTFAATLVEAAA